MTNFKELERLTPIFDRRKDSIIDSFLSKCEVCGVFNEKDAHKNLGDALFCEIIDRIYGANEEKSEAIARLLEFAFAKTLKFYEPERLKNALFDAFYDPIYYEKFASRKVEEELRELIGEFYEDALKEALLKNVKLSSICEDDAENNIKLLNEYKKAVDESNIVSKTDTRGVITYVNKQFCAISGYSEQELIGKPHNIVRHPDMPRAAFKDMWERIKSKETWKGVVKNMKKDGGTYIVDTTIVPITDLNGDIIEFIGIRHDITELEKAKEQLRILNLAMKKKVDELYGMTQDLEQQATTDTLTGIYNRFKFNELFNLEINKLAYDKKPLSLIIFDIDRFKEINDFYGHQAGDKALIEAAKIVSKNVPMSCVFARWGGEEFVILAPSCDINGGAKIAENIRKAIEAHIFDDVKHITASFGVAELFDKESGEDLVKKADEALYLAKRSGRNRVELFREM